MRRQLPQDWTPAGCLEWLAAKHPELMPHVEAIADQFRDHHTAKGSRMADWNAAFRTWCRNEAAWNGRRYAARPAPAGRDAGNRERVSAVLRGVDDSDW